MSWAHVGRNPEFERAKAGAVELKCPECGEIMRLISTAKGIFYACPDMRCGTFHGAHSDGRPVGEPADRETRDWRIKAHQIFDKLWLGKGKGARNSAYCWLQRVLGMTAQECHIGLFTAGQCQRVIYAVRQRQEQEEGSRA
jgi:ssDNA-binding Zn-finger/Zn-ribbon topoisomerase 1